MHKIIKCDKLKKVKVVRNMLKQLSINSSKGIFKTYKANILKKIEDILTIEEKEVEEIVFQMILKQIEIIKDTKQTSNIEIQTAQKIELQNQIQLYHKKKEILYEQYIKGKLTEEQFIKINLELTKELEPIQNKNKLKEIDFQLKYSKNTLQNQVKDIIKDTLLLLNKELVDFFIDKIYIFKENRIEVKWKIEDFLQKRQ